VWEGNMTKEEMVAKIAKDSSIDEAKVIQIINIFIEQVKTKLDEGEKVEIPGFGNFTSNDKK
jgi:nucleoid DNA-binding protein